MSRKQENNDKRVLVIGSTCADVIINLDHLPKTAEDIHPLSQSIALGGCAFNVALIIKYSGVPVTLLSPVGTGIYGRFVEEKLRACGFEITVRIPDQDNGCCYCLVEQTGERTFLSCHGAEYTFQKEWLDRLADDAWDLAYVCGLEIEEPTGLDLIQCLEKHRDRQFFYAPGPRAAFIPPEKMNRMYALHPILHLNETEAEQLSGCTGAEQAAGYLFTRTQNTVIITLGEKGACCLEADGSFCLISGEPAAVVDTIGAGDAHAGAVIAGISMGLDWKTAIKNANITAARVVGVRGASLSPEEFGTIRHLS